MKQEHDRAVSSHSNAELPTPSKTDCLFGYLAFYLDHMQNNYDYAFVVSGPLYNCIHAGSGMGPDTIVVRNFATSFAEAMA